MNYFLQVWRSRDLRRKILFTLFILLCYRVLAHIPVPLNGIDLPSLKQQLGGGALGVLSALTGGSLENFSIVMMGLAPYINASIIMQLMAVVFPKLEALKKEGAHGKRKMNQYTRWLTVPLALLQSYGMIFLISSSTNGVLSAYDWANVVPAMVIVTAGSLLVMWLGEIISEKGIGSGISLIIMAGIIAAIPGVFQGIFAGIDAGDQTKMASFGVLLVVTFVMLIAVVLMTEGQRRIPITYAARNAQSKSSSLPIRVLQAGMIPIIFAISLVSFPSIIAQIFQSSDNAVMGFIATHFNAANPTYVYFIVYFLLIVFFSYFYVSITFDPENVAEDIQKRGGFIPGRRPGTETSEYIGTVSTRLNLWGGSFLGLVAIVPLLFTIFSSLSSTDLILTGSGLIIVVGVVLDLIRRINAELVMHDYNKLV